MPEAALSYTKEKIAAFFFPKEKGARFLKNKNRRRGDLFPTPKTHSPSFGGRQDLFSEEKGLALNS